MVLFDSTFGKVLARVVLDQPHITYYGNSRPVTGRIYIKFTPRIHDVPELFGPIQIDVFLDGVAKTSIHVSKDKSSHTYRGHASLVLQRAAVFNGPVRLQPGEEESFPFTLCFPERIQHYLPRDTFHTAEDHMFNNAADQSLPPSLHSAWNTEDHGRKMTDAWVEYRVRSQVLMPHIDVRCSSFGEEQGGHLVHYEQAQRSVVRRFSATPIATQHSAIRVSNEFLLPESQRPVGFRARAKAFFDSDAYPVFAATCTVDGSADLELGQPLQFRVCFRPDIAQSTVSEVPQINLKYCWIHINGSTHIRTNASFRRERYLHRLTRLSSFEAAASNQSWSKANDYANTISTGSLMKIASTFSTFDITRTYTIDIELVVIVAQKEHKIKCKGIPVRVLPPAEGLPEAGPSDHAVLPNYQARAGPAGGEAPPEYQPPPPHANAGAVVQSEHEKHDCAKQSSGCTL